MQDHDSAARLPVSSTEQTAPVTAAAASRGLGRRIANQPPGYPNVVVWLRTGIVRDWRGMLGSLIACWCYVPVGLVFAVTSAMLSGLLHLVASGYVLTELVPDPIRDAPLVGSLIEQFVGRSGGILSSFMGFGLGFIGGLLLVLVLPWQGADGPIDLLIGITAVVAAAIVIGVFYTLFRVLFEPWLLKVSGARPMSRREADQLLPVLRECAQRLGLPSLPRLLVEDNPLTNAHAYARHIVVTTGVLSEPPEVIAALLSHELVHWRTGDEVTSAFVRGVGLPLVLVHAVPIWLMRRFPHPATNFMVFMFFWPVLVTMKYLVMPLHSRDVREAEYRADLGAVVAGHTEGLRALLEKQKAFESGRSGWEATVCASHPPTELRLDRLPPSPGVVGEVATATTPIPTVDTLFAPPQPFASRRTFLLVGAALLLLCLPSVPLGVVQWAFFRPQAAIDGYFSALADRDVAAAAKWLAPETRNQVAGDQTLTELVKSDAYQPITDVTVTALERDGDQATAQLSFMLDGVPRTGSIGLRRNESTTLGIFRGWHVIDGVGALAITDDQPGLRINGVVVPVPSEDAIVITAVPGVYSATVPQNPLSQTPPASIVVTPGVTQPVAVTVSPQLGPTAYELADAAVKRYLDSCAEQRVPAPADCPFSLYGGGQNVTWRIDTYPTLEIELVHAGLARVTTASDRRGQVTVSWRETDFFGDVRDYTKEVEFAVRGTLTTDGEALSFQPYD